MRFIIKLFTALYMALTFCSVAAAQQIQGKVHSAEVGIENTRLVYGQYTFKNHYFAKLNVSVYSEKLGFQYTRGTLGYTTNVAWLNLSGGYFLGTAFNGSYYNTGLALEADARILKRLLVDAKFIPWYDSGYGYNTCYEAKIGCRIIDNIDVNVGYTTIPEYRMSENRILAGFDFRVSNLYVSPYLSIGTKAIDGGKNVRVVFGFGYKF